MIIMCCDWLFLGIENGNQTYRKFMLIAKFIDKPLL